MDPQTQLQLATPFEGALWVFWQYLQLSPFVPLVVLAVRWRSLQSPLTFVLFAIPLSVGVKFLLDATIAAAEYLAFGASFAHPQGATWAFLLFGAQFYVVPPICFAVVWLLSQHFRDRSNGNG